MAYVNQIDLIGAILKHLDKQGVKTINPRQYNKVIEAANMIVDVFKPAPQANK